MMKTIVISMKNMPFPDQNCFRRALISTRICAAEMAVRYAALSACQKVYVCHFNSLGGAT